MSDQGRDEQRPPRRPPRPGGPPSSPKRKGGGLNLKHLGGNDFELVHPRCVREMELDYAEGMEIWKEGDPESARDAFRFALQGCGDNIWVHVALGRLALEEFRDPSLARGHFGYAFELAERALPPDFTGRMPRHRDFNRPYYEAIDGLASCYEALDRRDEAAKLRALALQRSGERGPRSRPAKEGQKPES